MPKTIVYSLSIHPVLQCHIPIAYVVNTDKEGLLGMMVRKATPEVVASFHTLPDDEINKKCLSICEEMTDENLRIRFIKSKRMTIAKLMAEPKSSKAAKSAISRQVNEFLQLIREYSLPLCLNVERKTKLESKRITVHNQFLSPLLRFEKSDGGINYTLLLAMAGQDGWHPASMDSHMVCDQPGWAIFDNRLFQLEHINGNKLKPFLKKKTVVIPNHLSHTYLEKFVYGLIAKVQVDVSGFELKEHIEKPKAILKAREDFIAENWILDLLFDYGEDTFHYWAKEDKRTRLIYGKNHSVSFSVTRRQDDIEEAIVKSILPLGVTVDQTKRLVFSQSETEPFHALHWLQQNKTKLEKQDISVELPSINNHSLSEHQVKISVSQIEDNDWFDIKAVITIGNLQVPFTELIDHIKNNNRVFELENDEMFIIPQEWMTQYASLARFAKIDKDKVTILKSQFGLLQDDENGNDDSLRIYEAPSEDIIFTPSALLKATLRPYQLSGIQWLINHQENGLGCCLADDMGLGKTVQTIAAILYAIENQNENDNDNIDGGHNDHELENKNQNKDENDSGPSESILKQQLNAAQQITPAKQLDLFGLPLPESVEAPIIKASSYKPLAETNNKIETNSTLNIQHSTLNKRSTLIIMPASLLFNWQAEFNKFAPHLFIKKHAGPKRDKTSQTLLSHDVILTSYQTALRDIDLLTSVEWMYVILDESQYIKNPASKIFTAIQSLQADHKISLSGTPIENSLSDLWAQMQFINPEILGSLSFFKKHFQKPIEKEQDESLIDELKSLTKAFLLRRTKKEVLTDLPEKTEQILYCQMSTAQAEEYESEKSSTRNMILQSDISDPQVKMQILSSLLRLRQLANHPVLYKSDYTRESGKFDIIKESLEKVRKSGQKALIFSSFTKHLDLVGKYLNNHNIPFVSLTGKTSQPNRQKAVKSFQDNFDIPFFLISIKAGGTGLNLTAANYVFILDPWWNPFVEEQAIARAHRIGLKHPLSVIKLISKDSIEEKIIKLQQKKLKLSEEFIDTGEKMSWTKEELGYLLE